MADESETSATASSGGNSWWNAAVSAGGTSLSQWSNISMLLPVTQSQQPSPCSSALTDLQTLNWSSDIPNSGRAGDQDVDNLSSSITNNTSSTLTMDSSNLSHQDLVDSGSLLDSSVQMAHFGTAVSDSQLWNQVLLGTSGSSSESIQSSMQNTPVGNLREVFYSRALRQELVEPSDHLKKIEDVQPLPGWEFRNLISFQPEDMNLSNIGKQISPLLYNSQLVDHDRLHTSNNALPDLGSWSVAPPDQQPGHHGLVAGRTICLNTFSSGLDAHIPQFDLGRIKQEYPMPYTNALGISPTNSSTLLQGFGAELNYKNEGFPHMLAESGNSKAFLKSNMAAGGCHITGDDQFSGRWPSSNSCSSGQLPVALSHVLPSSPSKQTTSNLTFGNSMNKQILDFSSCKPEKRQHTTDRSLQYFTVQHLEGKPVHNTAHHRTMPHGDEARDTSTDTKRSSTENCTADTIFKRPRFETSSTLPTFKVRKEKLGDRITALQQLVSPFGKTDTASVLLEAIGYIKFLQEQVQVLSTPYMKSGGTSIQGQAQGDQKGWGSSDKKDSDNEPKQDLRSRGLCLVPLSCTLHVANDNGADYWTPSLGGTYR